MWNTISLIQDLNCVAVSISYDDNHYTTGTSICRLFNAEAILLEEQEWYYLTHI